MNIRRPGSLGIILDAVLAHFLKTHLCYNLTVLLIATYFREMKNFILIKMYAIYSQTQNNQISTNKRLDKGCILSVIS